MKNFAKTLGVLFITLITIITPIGNVAAAGTPELLADINTAGLSIDINDDDGETIKVGSSYFFELCTNEDGCELAISDGTNLGTKVVREIAPGEDGANVSRMTGTDTHLFFFARESEDADSYMWVSDGTEAGTRQLRTSDDNLISRDDVDSDSLKAKGSLLYFVIDTGSGERLWVTDGTDEGTTEVAGVASMFSGFGYTTTDLELFGVTYGSIYLGVGESGDGQSRLFALRVNNTQAVEILENGETPLEAEDFLNFVTDGDMAYFSEGQWWGSGKAFALSDIETQPVEFSQGTGLVIFENFRIVGDYLWFTACGQYSANCEPWVTDGTVLGTEMLVDTNPGSSGSDIYVMYSDGSILYFESFSGSERKIYKTDGTVLGTSSFTRPETNDGWDNDDLGYYNGSLYFSYCEVDYDCELSILDSNMQRSVVKNIGEYWSSNPDHFMTFDTGLVFVADDNIHGEEFWFTDGTANGTTMMRDTQLGTRDSHGEDYRFFVTIGDITFFPAQSNEYGRELWRTDGTEEGTEMVIDLVSGTSGSEPRRGVAFNDELYFIAETANNERQLWKTDGTEVGTSLVAGVNDGYEYVEDLFVHNNELWFEANDGNNDSLYSTDGTTITNRTESAISYLESFETVGDKLFLFGYDANSQYALWLYNGISLQKIEGPEGQLAGMSLGDLTSFEGKLYFVANTEQYSSELWVTDGTNEGTSLVKDINPNQYYTGAQYLHAGNEYLYFQGDDGVHGQELWRSDGTAEGTVLVKDIYEGENNSSTPYNFVSLGNTVLFLAQTADDGRELWRTDGTEEGTVQVMNLNGSDNAEIENMTPVGPNLYFTAYSDSDGEELWIMNQTGSNVEMVYDINDGMDSSYPQDLTLAGSKLLFIATDGYREGRHGYEVWKIDDVDLTAPVDDEEEPEPEPEPEEEESNSGGRSSGRRARAAAAVSTKANVSNTTSASSGSTNTSSSSNGSSNSSGGNLSVRELQKFLNARGFTVAASGPGSTGNETDVFGTATQRALAAFQAANGLPAQGIYGPMTKAKIAELLAGTSWVNDTAAAPVAPTAPVLPSGSVRDLQVGMSGDDVRALQNLLITNGYAIPAGATGYFGEQTRTALAAWQAANGVTPASGYFGLMTRTKKKEMNVLGLWW